MFFLTFDFKRKKGSRIFWAIGVPKKIQIFKKILKKRHTGELHKKVQFCTRRRKSHFFLTHPVCKKKERNFSMLIPPTFHLYTTLVHKTRTVRPTKHYKSTYRSCYQGNYFYQYLEINLLSKMDLLKLQLSFMFIELFKIITLVLQSSSYSTV